MGLISALADLFRRTEDVPPAIEGGFRARGLDRPDGDDTTAGLPPPPAAAVVSEPPPDAAVGATFAIEYVDFEGRGTTRRITVHGVDRRNDGGTLLNCWCHERKAERSFRADRIRAIVDLDGEVHDPAAFLARELGIVFAAADPPEPASRPSRKTVKAADAARDLCSDGIRLLVGLARSDTVLHPAELAVILGYVEARCARHGAAWDAATATALRNYVKRLVPTIVWLRQALDRMEREPAAEQRHLLDAAVALADADGVADPLERAVLDSIRAALNPPSGSGPAPA